jgi:hypothetical protein
LNRSSRLKGAHFSKMERTTKYTKHTKSSFFRVFREGMSFVNGAPWSTQDAVAERTEAVSP